MEVVGVRKYTMKFLAVCENCDDCKVVYKSDVGVVAGVACGLKTEKFPLIGLVSELPEVPTACQHRNEIMEVEANV